MSTVTVSIDRTSLSLSALAITDDGSTYQLRQDGLTRPGVTWRKTAMPDSDDVHGTEFVSAVREQTSVPLEVIVKGTSASALGTALDALEAALSQFSFSVTVTVDGQAKTWSASPATWSYSQATGPAMVSQWFELLTITIPVYPIAS